MGNKGQKRIKMKYIVVMALVLTAGILGFFGVSTTYAADEIYIMDQYGNIINPAVTMEMKTSTLQLQLKTEGTAYESDDYVIKWTIEDADQQKFATVSPGSLKTIGIVKALSPGDVTVTVTVIDRLTDASIAQTTCNIRVIFSIDTTTDDSIYKKVNESDTDRSLVLYSDSSPVQLGLNFGDAANTQWTSANEEVVTVTQKGGLVTPVGAGKTRVIATYTPTGETNTYTAYLDVYVIPQVSDTGGTGTYKKSMDLKIKSGESLYTDTVFTNNLEVIRSKIVWVVKQDDGNGNSVVIANSLGQNSDLIDITPTASRSNELKIEGRAGEYDVYFYTYGSYFSEDNHASEEVYTPTVVHLTIKSDISDREEIIHIGDRYDFAEAYNMTTEDFNDCFNIRLENSLGGSPANYVTYDDVAAILTANKEGEVKATLSIKSGKEEYVKKLLGLDPGDTVSTSFTTRISITERFLLNSSNCVLGVGETYQLKVEFDGTIDGKIEWSSSDDKFVTVTEDGLIKGIKITTTDVTITASLRTGDGIERKATCIVKVEPAVTDFTLSPGEDQTLLSGEHITVIANIKQMVSIAPIDWFSTDTSVFTVEASSDKKSAVITGVSGGSADLVAYNRNNPSNPVTLRVTVKVPIDSISFASPDISIGLYKGGYNMKKEVSYTPANVTEAEKTLKWSSSDTSVATVDEDGYMTFTGAGQTLISVYPAYNPYNVMASCLVTVIGTPDSMSLSETDITMNTGESKVIEVNYTPENTITSLTWTPTDPNVATVTYDETRQIATVAAKAPGSTIFNVVSTEGLIANLKVTVKQPAEEITLSPKELVILTGTSSKLIPALKPANSTDTLVWKSYNTAIAKVDANGTVTGVKEGTTFIQVTAYNGKVAGPTTVIQVIVRDGVKGISLDSYEKTVYVGNSITLSPIFNPATAYNKEVKWSVANSKIASVKASGVSNARVTGVKPGTTLVTGTTTDGGYSVACLIVVKAKPKVNDTKVTVSPKTKYLKLGKSFYVTARVTGTSNKKVKWKSSKKKVCTVSASGKVKGKKIGTAYIKATARDGSGAYARCKVRVVRRVKKLTLNKYSARVLVGSTLKLKAKVKPKNATIKKLKWTSSDKTVATVNSNGRVYGLAEGMVKIRAKTTDGSNKSATCIVRVMEPVDATGVSVANKEITIEKGKAIQSGIAVSPANATTKIKYFSDNKKVATVDKRGKIRTKRVGQATIYGKTANGKIGYCDVLVVDLNRKGLVMRQYDTEQLSVNMVDSRITWYSKNINIATVSPTGLVTGRRKGKTTIYANVNGVKLGCRVRVKKIK